MLDTHWTEQRLLNMAMAIIYRLFYSVVISVLRSDGKELLDLFNSNTLSLADLFLS